jgi:hypothetical protein
MRATSILPILALLLAMASTVHAQDRAYTSPIWYTPGM